jgi:hypothetical protein
VLGILVDTVVGRCQVSERNKPTKRNQMIIPLLVLSLSMLSTWSDGSSVLSIVNIGMYCECRMEMISGVCVLYCWDISQGLYL